MNIQISSLVNGKVIGFFPINLGGTLGQTEEEYFAEAWRCAVADRLVSEGEKANYDFKSVSA